MINILLCGNEHVYDGMITCMLSIFKRTRTTEPFCFYIYTMDASHIKREYVPVTQTETDYLDEVAKSYNEANRVLRFDVTRLYRKEFANCPNEQCYCSPYTLLRLLADEVEGMPDKLLYLDVDVLLNRDIHLLYDIDVTEYEYAAARDHYGKYLVNPNYINAGVLLLNLKMIKETGLLVKARELIRNKKLPFADQSAIYRCTTKKKMLPQRFNDQKFLHGHTVVRHFSKRLFYLPVPHTENIKPWRVSMVHSVFHYYMFDDVLYEYIYLIKRFNARYKVWI